MSVGSLIPTVDTRTCVFLYLRAGLEFMALWHLRRLMSSKAGATCASGVAHVRSRLCTAAGEPAPTTFVQRHVGPRAEQQRAMLASLKLKVCNAMRSIRIESRESIDFSFPVTVKSSVCFSIETTLLYFCRPFE